MAMERRLGLIPALDCDLEKAIELVLKVDNVAGVYGYKVGFVLGLAHGLPKVVERIRKISKKPVIYDHQKAATDIPDTGEAFARTLAAAGVDEAILFPQAGPETLTAWTRALQLERLKVIVGGVMTHPKYLASEGGFLADEGILSAYGQAAQLGVRAFVVPMTKPELVRGVAERLGAGDWEFYSPGLGAQGGSLAGFDFLKRHYAIVGRSLLKAEDPARYLEGLLKEATP
ncbi:MAG: orotidine 5'-phosphate decarboxylase [Deltaproteobacteria bacterium]|nr:orotidine 5'-phosphate decarboxylase [Deltaproteobacteria bacterium]